MRRGILINGEEIPPYVKEPPKVSEPPRPKRGSIMCFSHGVTYGGASWAWPPIIKIEQGVSDE